MQQNGKLCSRKGCPWGLGKTNFLLLMRNHISPESRGMKFRRIWRWCQTSGNRSADRKKPIGDQPRDQAQQWVKRQIKSILCRRNGDCKKGKIRPSAKTDPADGGLRIGKMRS